MRLQSRRLGNVAIFVLLWFAAMPAMATAQGPVTVVDLGGLFPGGTSSAIAVNDAGVVVGVAQPRPSSRTSNATIWVNGVAKDLGTLCVEPCPFEASSFAADVNESGQVVGSSRQNDAASRGFIWEEGKGLRILVPLDGDHESAARGINNRGETVGNSQRILADGDRLVRPVLWTADGIPHELQDWTTGQALDINDSGQIVGVVSGDGSPSRAVRWENGMLTPLDTLFAPCPSPSSAFSRSSAINEFGHITGDLLSCDGSHYPVTWIDRATQMLDLRGGSVGADRSGTGTINDAIDVAGMSLFDTGCDRPDGTTGTGRATLWKHGMSVDLGTLVDDPCETSEATGINNHGLVVGRSRSASGPEHAVLFRLPADLARGPFGGTPAAIPGRLEATRYDVGGPGVGYLDTTPGNEGGTYRWDDVDVKPSRHGGHALGWTTAGEWLSYSVSVQRTGFYNVQARVGSMLPGRTFHLEADGVDITGPIAVPQLADWDEYATVTVDGVALNAGTQTLRLVIGPQDSIDVHWIAFEPALENAPRMLPGRIEAEDYDRGGPGQSYLDTTPGNEQGSFVYRDDDVDIKTSAEGGYAIGWLVAGEWLTYTIAVPDAGAYRWRARVGTPLSGRTFHIEVDGRDVTGAVAVPQTGGWDQYVTLELPSVDLTAGTHVVRLVMGSEDFMDFQWLEVTR